MAMNAKKIGLRTKYLAKKAINEPELIIPFLKIKYRNWQKPPQLDIDNPEINEEEFKEFYQKLKEKVGHEFEDIEGEKRGTEINIGGMDYKSAKNLYNLIRREQPEVVVETGVCNGVSTAVVLKALHDNQKGKLHSIDLPDYPDKDESKMWHGKGGAVLPPGKKSGWIIPDKFRDRWNLIEGDSNYELPRLLENLDEINMFIHDSEHSYQTMMTEMCLAWRHLSKDDYLLVDDFRWNNAFKNFASSQRTKKYSLGDYGVLKKENKNIE